MSKLDNNQARAAGTGTRGDMGTGRLRPAKRTFRLTGAAGKKCAEMGVFTPCADPGSLLEAIHAAAKKAASGDVILPSAVCASFDQFRNFLDRGTVFENAMDFLATATGSGVGTGHPNRQAAEVFNVTKMTAWTQIFEFAPGFFEEKPRCEKPHITITSHERTLTSASVK